MLITNNSIVCVRLFSCSSSIFLSNLFFMFYSMSSIFTFLVCSILSHVVFFWNRHLKLISNHEPKNTGYISNPFHIFAIGFLSSIIINKATPIGKKNVGTTNI